MERQTHPIVPNKGTLASPISSTPGRKTHGIFPNSLDLYFFQRPPEQYSPDKDCDRQKDVS
jgi:hypothetical protein